jgi:hypothetical protein
VLKRFFKDPYIPTFLLDKAIANSFRTSTAQAEIAMDAADPVKQLALLQERVARKDREDRFENDDDDDGVM